eukprot:s793_g9.t1
MQNKIRSQKQLQPDVQYDFIISAEVVYLEDDDKVELKPPVTAVDHLKHEHLTVSPVPWDMAPRTGQRVIAHLDLDCFYVQVEHRRLGLGKPPWTSRESPAAAVQQWDGLIAVNYAARAHGVKRGMRAADARKACPDITLVHVETISEGTEEMSVDHGESLAPDRRTQKACLRRYRQASEEVFAVVQRHATRCEMASIDEVYLDLTEEVGQRLSSQTLDLPQLAESAVCPEGCMADVKDSHLLAALDLVQKLRDDIFVDTGFTVSAGISESKLVAKLASACHKPNRQTLVPSAGVLSFMASVKLKDLIMHVFSTFYNSPTSLAEEPRPMPFPATSKASDHVEKKLRKVGVTGPRSTKLSEKDRTFYRQEKAVELLKELIESGQHKPSEVTLFAEEVGRGGKRRFIVDTFAHFAMEKAPLAWPKDDKHRGHFYEVILENRPCWLYFDLEFSLESNPKLKPKVVMHAFRKTLEAFCQDVLGMKLDTTKILELESSTPKKFSRHVIVKTLWEYPDGDEVQRALAFANNAQTGLLVNHLVKYAETHRDESWSLSRYLFVEAPGQDVGQQRQVCVIDESVYSRNRSFRLLFQSKFGKDRRLDLDHSRDDEIFGGKPYPAIALLQTMASFVPEGTELFQHHLIPSDYGHAQAVISRISRGGSVGLRRGNGSISSAQCDPLLNHLVCTWDETRRLNEVKFDERRCAATNVQSCVELEGRIITVTLGNNRFCWCKGASHLSNHVYLVADLLRGDFYQTLDD